MEKDLRAIEILNREYPYGFVTDIDEDSRTRRFKRRHHPTDFGKEARARMDAGVAFASVPAVVDDEGADVGERPLSADRLPGHPLLSAPKTGNPLKSLSEVDPELLRTYEKLGIPLKERELLAGVAVDAYSTAFRSRPPSAKSSKGWAFFFVRSPKLSRGIRTWCGNTWDRWCLTATTSSRP